MKIHISLFCIGLVLIPLTAPCQQKAPTQEPYYNWQAVNFAIEQPLGGLKGDPGRGRKVAISQDKGNCLACHHLPVEEESFHGTIGPPLDGIASRLTAGQIRLRIVDEQKINPATVMPGFYKNPMELNKVANEYYGKTMLSAQEVEDLVAYMTTLK